MMSDRKFFWLTWVVRIVTLFGTSGGLFIVYVRTFVEPDVMESWMWAISALISASLFFSTFPWLRMRLRANQLRKQLCGDSDFYNYSTKGASTKNDVSGKNIVYVILLVTAAFVIFNFVLGRAAYLDGNDLELFVHMVVVVATVLMWNTILLIYKVDENFKEIHGLISQYRKDQEKSRPVN